MKLGENLQAYRKKAGLSQEEFAEKCEVSRQVIAKWESGESVPTIDKLFSLQIANNKRIKEPCGSRALFFIWH